MIMLSAEWEDASSRMKPGKALTEDMELEDAQREVLNALTSKKGAQCTDLGLAALFVLTVPIPGGVGAPLYDVRDIVPAHRDRIDCRRAHRLSTRHGAHCPTLHIDLQRGSDR